MIQFLKIPKYVPEVQQKKRGIQDPDIGMLNTDQRESFDSMLEFAQSEETGMFVLTGFGGVGKSFTIAMLTEYLIYNSKTPYQICMSAPTNQAVKVLTKMCDFKSGSLFYSTIHKLLGLKQQRNWQGEIEFVRDKQVKISAIKNLDLLIVDEVSMLNDPLFYHLVEFIEESARDLFAKKKLKIIFMGDACFGKGTEIRMANGSLKNVEDVAIGDNVMGNNNEPKEVIRTTKGRAPLYRVNQTNAESYVVNGAHKLCVRERTGPVELISADKFYRLGTYSQKRLKGFKKETLRIIMLSTLSVESIGLGEYYGFELDHEDRRFLLADGTVVHNCQIPPIRTSSEDMSNNMEALPLQAAVQADFGMRTSSMSTPVRQALGSPIFAAVSEVREGIYSPNPITTRRDNIDKSGNGIVFAQQQYKEYTTDIIHSWFMSDNFMHDPNFCKVIAWRNKTVHSWNAHLRFKLFGKDIEEIVAGEKLIVNKPIFDNGLYGIKHSKADLLKVIEAKPTTFSLFGMLYHVYECDVVDIYNGFKSKIMVLNMEKSGLAYATKHLELKNQARQNVLDKVKNPWAKVFVHEGKFADVRYNYGITSHLAQGTTIKNVVCIESDILINQKIKERNSILYTAMSRASDRLLMI